MSVRVFETKKRTKKGNEEYTGRVYHYYTCTSAPSYEGTQYARIKNKKERKNGQSHWRDMLRRWPAYITAVMSYLLIIYAASVIGGPDVANNPSNSTPLVLSTTFNSPRPSPKCHLRRPRCQRARRSCATRLNWSACNPHQCRAHCIAFLWNTRASSSARCADADKHLLAVFELVDEALLEFDLLRIGVRCRRAHGLCNDVCERPACHNVVLVDVGHKQAVRRENEFGVVVKVEL